MIPRIVHSFNATPKGWITNHPSYRFIVWDTDKCIEFIKQKHPLFYSHVYIHIKGLDNKMKIGKYLILYTYGGIYVDQSIESVKSIEPFLNAKDSLKNEGELDAMVLRFGGFVSDSLIIAVAQSKFIKMCIVEIVKRRKNIYNQSRSNMITTVYTKYSLRTPPFKVEALPNDLFGPCGLCDRKPCQSDKSIIRFNKSTDLGCNSFQFFRYCYRPLQICILIVCVIALITGVLYFKRVGRS